MLKPVHRDNPKKQVMDEIANNLKKGKIYILPTDTVYAFVTVPDNKKSIEKLYQLKSLPVGKKPLSLYCRDFSQASQYIRMTGNQAFRWGKAHLPGPYTLVFQASKLLPQISITNQKTVGIRIIEHPVIEELLARLDQPLIGTSVFTDEDFLTYPEELDDKYGKQIEAVVDCGPIEPSFSTVLDMRTFPPDVLREGKGEISDIY